MTSTSLVITGAAPLRKRARESRADQLACERGSAGMAQRLRPRAAPAEDPGSVPSTPHGDSQPPATPVPGDLFFSSGPREHSHVHDVDTHADKHLYTENKSK